MAHLVIQAAENTEQVKLANALMARAHQPDHRSAQRWIETCGAGAPEAAQHHTRIALWNGSLAAALRVTAGTIRIGEARLRLGGLGWLTTSPRHRHKGIGRALLSDTLGYLRAHNYHLAMIFGVPNFYRRFGFETVLREYAWQLPAEAGIAPSGACRVRAGKPGDIRAVRAIHERNDGDTACSLVRSAAHITNRWEAWKPLRVLTDDAGRVTGYFVPRQANGTLEIIESGAEDAASCANVLGHCVALARDQLCGTLRFAGPHDRGFGAMAQELVKDAAPCATNGGGGMMSLVNTGEAFESMLPEFESRCAGSDACEADTEITFVLPSQRFRLHSHRGAIAIGTGGAKNKIGLEETELLALVTGHNSGAGILDTRRRILAPEARALAEALFPQRRPYVWPLDRF